MEYFFNSYSVDRNGEQMDCSESMPKKILCYKNANMIWLSKGFIYVNVNVNTFQQFLECNFFLNNRPAYCGGLKII